MAKVNVEKLLARAKQKVGKDLIVKAIQDGFSVEEIAKSYNIAEAEVELQYNYMQSLKEDANSFKVRKTDELYRLMERILNSVTDEDVSKMSAYQKVLCIGILEDKISNLEGRNKYKIEIEHKLLSALMVGRNEPIEIEAKPVTDGNS